MIGTISLVGTQWIGFETLIGLKWFNSVDLSQLFGCAGAWGVPMHGCPQVRQVLLSTHTYSLIRLDTCSVLQLPISLPPMLVTTCRPLDPSTSNRMNRSFSISTVDHLRSAISSEMILQGHIHFYITHWMTSITPTVFTMNTSTISNC